MKLGELLFEVGFKADTMKLKEFGRAVADLNMSSILSAGSFWALYEAAKSVINVAQDLGEGVNKFTMETGKSGDALQRWVKVGHQAGVTGDVIETTIRGIAESMAEIQMGKPPADANFWARIGLAPDLLSGKDPSVVFKDMLERLKSLGTTQSMALLQNYGKSVQLLDVIKQFPDLQKAYNDQIVLTPKELALINKNMIELNKASDRLQVVWAELGVTLLPAFDKMLIDFTALIDKMNKSENFKNFLELITKLTSLTGKVLGKSAEGYGKLYGDFKYAREHHPDEVVHPFMKPFWEWGKNSTSTAVTQHNTIHVHGVHDPEAVGKAVDDHLGKKIDHAIANGSTGGW